ncbi:unnamed protein product [Lactuca saligna]|uniref:non-specific serine/threonine protein kinase n=1 Tax=Lactuca saligna TaxID=75948 RepID=A0AA35VG47_LACSI|nr:unnamed protein product [Lactuca saligna]
MAAAQLRLVFITIVLRFIAAQQNDGSVSVGASLKATSDVKPWLSSSGEFAFGFKQVQGNDNFLLSIWYEKIPDKTIVWYPEEGRMVPTGSKVELLRESGLVLTDPQGTEVWRSGSISGVASGFMNDTGNFVVFGGNSRKLWGSYDFPANTLLPTQVMERGGGMNSTISPTNFSGGRFQLRLLPDGNLVLNIRDTLSGNTYDAYYISGTYDDSNSTNSGEQVIFDATGYMYILRRNGQRFDLTPRGSLPSGDYYHRATLDSDGVFRQYYFPKNPISNTNWEVIWFVPDNICVDSSDRSSTGACGFNNVCSFDGNRPNCECPKGFSLLDPNNPSGDCKPDFTPTCDEVDSNNGRGMFDFIELQNIDWPFSDYVHMNPSNENTCKSSCLEDCFCAVAIYRDTQCWKKKLPLSNGRKVDSANVRAFVKYQIGDHPLQNPLGLPGKNKDRRSLIVVGSVLLGTSVFIIFVLTGVICVGFFVIYKKKPMNTYSIRKAVETNLPSFTYQELVEATDGFKDELGKGGFGIVYKGVIGKKIVAVKKLNTVVHDSDKEFKTEVDTIAKTHHKNLVQLLGYCDEGDQRLLVYEYMSNGTLAMFLFGDTRPTWRQRSHIAVGIAKGLAYLHEECSTQIIHCDIKPKNILLDDYCNAKISDFGMAKLLMLNQSHTNTGIRGTKGYLAPEWFRNTPVTIKVDVYSFGVLLLEIISCRKSLVFESDDEGMVVLTDLAWDCYQEGRLEAFVENDLEALNDHKKLATFVMVGLWCVQENSSLRPTMRKVNQMLEGGIEVVEPPCPYSSFSVTNY